MIRLTTSGSERVPTPAMCGSPVIPEKVPPPKSSTKNCDSCGVVVSAIPATTDRSVVLLPLRGPPTTARWPGAAGQVDRQGVAALLARPVHGAEGHDEATERAPLLRHQAELRVHREVRHQLVEGVRHVERRQPDLVRGGAVADHVVDRDVEQRLLVAGVDRSRLGLRLVDRDVELAAPPRS